MMIATRAACARWVRVAGRRRKRGRIDGTVEVIGQEPFSQRGAVERAVEERCGARRLPDGAQQDHGDGHHRRGADRGPAQGNRGARDGCEQDGQHERLHRAHEARPHTGVDPQQAAASGVFLDERPHVQPAPALHRNAEIARGAPAVVEVDRARGPCRAQHTGQLGEDRAVAGPASRSRTSAAPIRRGAAAPSARRRGATAPGPSTALG